MNQKIRTKEKEYAGKDLLDVAITSQEHVFYLHSSFHTPKLTIEANVAMTLRNIFVALITFLGLATALDGKSTNKHVIPKILERFDA